MSAAADAITRARRLVRRVGKFTLLALAVAACGVVVTLTAVVLSSIPLGMLGLSLSLLGLLAGLVVGQRTRRPSAPRATAAPPAPVPLAAPTTAAVSEVSLSDLIRVQEAAQHTITQQHELLARDLHQRLDVVLRDVRVQQGALTQLYAAHRAPSTLPVGDEGPNPSQLLGLLDMVSRRRPARVLAVDTGGAALWLASALAELGGKLDVVEHDASVVAELRTAQPLEGVGSLLAAGTAVPAVAHAYLPWYDLIEAGDEYDLVVVHAAGHRARAALPVLPLLHSRLAAGGAVALLDEGSVGDAWAETPDWHSELQPGSGMLLLRPEEQGPEEQGPDEQGPERVAEEPGVGTPAGGPDAAEGPDATGMEVSPPSFPGSTGRRLRSLSSPPLALSTLPRPTRTRFFFLGTVPASITADGHTASGWPQLRTAWPPLPSDPSAGVSGSATTATSRAGATGGFPAQDVSLVLLVGSGAAPRLAACLRAVAKDARLRRTHLVVVHAEEDLALPEELAGGVRWVRADDDSRPSLSRAALAQLAELDTTYLVVSTLPRAKAVDDLARQAERSLRRVGEHRLGSTSLLLTPTTPREVVSGWVSHVLITQPPGEVERLAQYLGTALLDASRPVLDAVDPRDGDVELRVFVQTQLDPDVPIPPWRYRVVLEAGGRVVARSEPVPLVRSVDRAGVRRPDDLLARVPLTGLTTGHYRLGLELDGARTSRQRPRSIRARQGALLAARSVTMVTREGDGARVRYLLLQGGSPDTCYLSVTTGTAAEVERTWRRSLLRKDLALLLRGRDRGRLRWWRLVRLLTRPFYARQRIWLVSERSDTAQDNGLHLYAHLRRGHPGRRVHYVIDADSPQRARVQELGGVVAHSSLRHRLLMLHAEVLASTNSIHYLLPRGWDPGEYARDLAWRVGALRVYLKHGVHLSPNAVKRGAQGYDLVLTVTPRETAALRSVSGYDQQLVETGLPRYDALSPTPPSRTIVFMSTWRRYLVPRLFSGDESDRSLFDGSTYQRFTSALLGSERLHRMLIDHDFRLLFVPHYQLSRYFEDAPTAGDRITVGDVDESDLQGMLRRCDVFLTDHSSVHFDVAYLDTPIVYARFDRQEFETLHASPDWFDYERDGFGPVTYTLEQTLDALEEVLDRGCTQVRRFRARADAEFSHRDHDNCRRTVAAIDQRLAVLNGGPAPAEHREIER